MRFGRVKRIERRAVILEGGEVETTAEDLYIDCTASALGRRPTRPVLTLGELRVQKQWAEDPALRQWVSEHRLTASNLRSKRTDRPLDLEGKAIRDRLSLATPRAIANLEQLIAL